MIATQKEPENMIKLVLFIIWIFVEIVRLYTGYYGNIKESFPEMLTFVVISIIGVGLLVVAVAVPANFALENCIIIINLVFNGLEIIWE